MSKAALRHLNESSTSASRSYDSNTRSATPSYSIYPANDMYIYERSLSSKSDRYSNTEYDGASTTASSAFSPATSTDSTMVLRSPMTTESMLDSRPSTPTTARNAFPVLSQAQSAFRDVFRTQTPQSTRPDNVLGRSTTPIRLSSTSAGSDSRSMNPSAESYSAPAPTSYASQSYTPSIVSESDDGELHRLARANAEYNAASSAYYSSQHSSTDFTESHNPPAPGTAPDAAAVPRQIYSNLPLRSSPEQQHHVPDIYSRASGGTSQEDSSLYLSDTHSESRARSRPLYHHGESQPNDRVSVQSDDFLPPLPHLDQEAVTAGRPPPIRRQSEYRATSQIPEIIRNEAPLSRYVPASRTMMPNVSGRTTASSPDSQISPRDSDRTHDRALPIPPPVLSQQPSLPRERNVSLSQPHAPYPLSQGMPIPSASADGRPAAPTPLSQRHNSQRERTVSFSQSQSQPSHPMPQGIQAPNPPRQESETSRALDHQAGEREADTVRRSPQGQRPMPSSSYPRDSGSARDQLPALFSGISILTLPDGAPPALSSSPQQMSYDDIRRQTSAGDTSRYRHDQRHQFTAASDPSRPPAENPPSNFRPASEQVPEISGRRKLPVPNTSPVRHDSRPTQFPNDSRLPPAVAPPIPSHTRPQQTHPSELNPSRNQSTSPPARQHNPTERGRSADGAIGNDSHSPTTHRRPSVSFTAPAPDPREGTQPPRSYNAEMRSADAAVSSPFDPSERAGYYDSSHNHESRRTSFVAPQHKDSTSSRPHTSFRPSGVARSHEEASSSFPNSSSENPRTRIGSKVDMEHNPQSHTPFPEPPRPIPEPHRRHSDGDRSANNDFPSRHLPSYASSDPTNNTTGQNMNMNMGAPRTSPTTSMPVDPQRRFSDGDQVANTSGRNSALIRSVRWNENLVCASPIWPSQRRKGWFNRRG